MRAGSLRRRVIIQNQTTTQDDVGQPLDSWTNFAKVWAAVEDISGRELVRDGAVSAQVTTLVRFRHRPGFTSALRIIDGARTLEAVAPAIDKSGRRRELEVMCREVTP